MYLYLYVQVYVKREQHFVVVTTVRVGSAA